ncbi:MAG: MBL fold metallo-hydrolase [Pseudomonadota bacterium]
MTLKPLLIATTMLATSTVASAQDATMTEVADGVFHFFAMGYSSMVVVGEDGVLVTDPSFTPRAEILQAELAKITDKPVTHVALSHEHFDHVGGTEVFEGAEIILQENGIDILKLSPLMPTPEVSTTFDDELTIDLGNQTVELSHLAVADGVATTVARVAESNVVFSVDMYMPQKFSPHEFKEDTNFVGTAVILNTLVDWNPSYAINGHSAGNSVEALKENARFFNELQAKVEAKFQEAFASDDPAAPWDLLFSISEEIEMPEYSDWENYETAFPAYVRRMALSVLHGG